MSDGDSPAIVIKHNKYARHEACGICDGDRQLCVGPCLFLDGTWQGVCQDCARKHAPGLLSALNTPEFQKAYWTAERDAETQRAMSDHADRLADLEADLAFLEARVAATQTLIDQLKKDVT